MDLARLKTIKLFRKAHPAVHPPAAMPQLSATVANHATTASSAGGSLSPISVPKRSQSQSKISERTSDIYPTLFAAGRVPLLWYHLHLQIMVSCHVSRSTQA